MRILVTGATGFIGNYVIKELLKYNFEIVATSSSKAKAETKDWYTEVSFIEYSFSGFSESQDLFTFFKRPDILIHLAWSGLPNYKDFMHIDKNLFNQFFFLQNLVKNGLRDVLVTGTCLEYGMQSGPLKEDMITFPDNPYAIAKDSLREFIEAYQRVTIFDFKWVRLFYMYGKGQNVKSLIPLLEKSIASGEKSFKMSGGEQLRDYLKVESVAEFLVKIALQKKVQGIINCCSGKPVSVRSFVEQYLTDNNLRINLDLGCYPYPDYEPMAFWGNNEKLKSIMEA